MAEEVTEQPPINNDALKAPKSPFAKGYWGHLLGAILLVLLNFAVLIGLMAWSYEVYQEAKRVAQVTPDKRIKAMQVRAKEGRKSLFVTVSDLGLDAKLKALSESLEGHRQFYQDMLSSEEDFSRLLHLQQIGVSHFADNIGQSKVWQDQYIQHLLPLPTKSAKRQNFLLHNLEKLQQVPTMSEE